MMPCVIQPGGGGGKMRVHYTAHRRRGLIAAYKRMQAEGLLLHAAAEELCVSAANLSRWALQGLSKINRLDKIVGVYIVMVCPWTNHILARNPLLEVEADLSCNLKKRQFLHLFSLINMESDE